MALKKSIQDLLNEQQKTAQKNTTLSWEEALHILPDEAEMDDIEANKNVENPNSNNETEK